jgi:hypothetical protein
LEIRNPLFHLRVVKEGRVLYEGYRKPGEAAAFDGLELVGREIRYWTDLLIVREYGTMPLFVGFLLGAVGLIMRLVFFQRTVRVHVADRNGACVLYLGGRSEYYQQTYHEELERLADGLADTLRGSRGGGAP